ncbi:unnamed protein product [Rotaria sp. Silwood1]|nr:unnamed protein product [Rotaria sp. Silwood1]CAF3620424.1 unnamed protein product [Rotaria sp. Silwood1]CAF3644128.1 unnamed protein product [Rotaria sp. Silwood1]CAF5017558.1 unnamed protein product [Rotaria sp. Silwood1]
MDNNEEPQEKLTDMIIDDTNCLAADPTMVSGEFNRRDITLAVVAVRTSVCEIWDIYRELASDENILLAGAPYVSSRVISSAVTGEDTLRKPFLHMNIEHISTVANHLDDVDEQSQTTN